MDFGTNWIKMSGFKLSKGFISIEDHMSKRKTNNIISICKNGIFYEY